MKNIFKKIRRGEKQIFLVCNIILFVAILIGVWNAYDSNNKESISPIFTEVQSVTESESQDKTVITENVTEATTVYIKEDITQVTTTTEDNVTELDFPIYHSVKYGDSWCNISAKYFNTEKYADAIAYTNNKKSTDYIFVGEIILIESEEYLINIVDTIKATDPNDIYTDGEVYTFFKGAYGYSYGVRPNPSIDITVDKDNNGRNYTGEVDTSTFEYVGKHKITGYDPYCTHCCSGTGLMASGVYAVNGYSVAAGAYPIGTTLYIEGYGFYVVEDRGGSVNGNHIDIAAPSHEACYALTNNSVRVYIVPNNN